VLLTVAGAAAAAASSAPQQVTTVTSRRSKRVATVRQTQARLVHITLEEPEEKVEPAPL
jgi:hypothetical protein